ncbi:MAG: ATP-binding protein [Myxococcota bacterium]|nr:ATP-binding protein [Myxococcota bacterium]
MHPFLGIPLASIVTAAVLASAVAARERDRMVSRLLCLMLFAAGVWSLFDLAVGTAPDDRLATLWLRASTLGAFPVGALLLHLLVHVWRPAMDRARPLIPFAYGVAGLAGAVSVATGWTVAGAVRTSWGWGLVPGPAHFPVYALVSAAPVFGLASVLLGGRRGRPRPRRRPARAVLAGGVACFGVGTLTDILLPAAGVACPKLGSAALVAWGAAAWWILYRNRDLRLAPQRFAREILETLPDAVVLVRLDGRIRSANGRLAALAGCGPEDPVGRGVADFLPELDPEQADSETESELVTASGERIPVSVCQSSLTDTEGRVIGRVLVLRDLREVVSLRSQLASSGRLVAVGQLAAGIAHEINNPIAYVGANLRLLGRHWEELGEALGKADGDEISTALAEGPELLAECDDGVSRVTAIVRDVGGFSGGGSPERVSADVVELLDAATRVAGPQLSGARIERDYRDRPTVPCVTQELMQVFLNLLVNAGQALGEQGVIRLVTRIEAGEAVVEVADDGAGIPAELQERIFEPFFTTKPVGEGTGLGLSISRQIVEQHGGRLSLESAPGRGTSFTIRLPTAPGDEP